MSEYSKYLDEREVQDILETFKKSLETFKSSQKLPADIALLVEAAYWVGYDSRKLHSGFHVLHSIADFTEKELFMSDNIKWFVSGNGIQKGGPYDTQVEAVDSMRYREDIVRVKGKLFPPDIFVWPEIVKENK